MGGIALCQVAVTVTYTTCRGHALIGRALYLPECCAADDEHRELASVPKEVLFATKPQLADALLDCAHVRGIRAAFVAGDEVYGGRQLRRSIRERGMGYVLAVRADHVLTAGSGRAVTAAAAAGLIPARAWQRMRIGSRTKGTGTMTGRCWRWPATIHPADTLTAQRATGPPTPLRRHAVVLPLLDTGGRSRCSS